MKRILHEEQIKQEQEQLARLLEAEASGAERLRISERSLKADLERRQKELEDLEGQEEDWVFDCSVCGVHGQNLVSGTY